jgi:hypothetical protein
MAKKPKETPIDRKKSTSTFFSLDWLTKKQYYELEIDGEKLYVCLAKKKDLKDLAKFEKENMNGIVKPYSTEDFEKIFCIGKIIILRNKGKELVGYFSVSFGPKAHDKLPIKENEAYYSGVAFAEKYRGKGVFGKVEQLAEKLVRQHTVVIDKGNGEITEEKIARIIGITRSTNASALRAMEKALFTYDDYNESKGDERVMPPEEDDKGMRLKLVKELDATEKIAGHMCEMTRNKIIAAFGKDVVKTFPTDDGRFHIVIKNQKRREPVDNNTETDDSTK